jgi:hypothetical protein
VAKTLTAAEAANAVTTLEEIKEAPKDVAATVPPKAAVDKTSKVKPPVAKPVRKKK